MKSLEVLMETIQNRKENPVEGSYTSYLFSKGEQKILKKIAEESGEVLIASLAQSNEDVVLETCDLIYHLMVLLAQKGISLDEIDAELSKRAEKQRNFKGERKPVENL